MVSTPTQGSFNKVAIPSLYDEVRIDVKKEMVDNTFYYSATADLWSSCTTEPYLCYTIHYIDDDWILQCHCLQAHFMHESHTGNNLHDAFLDDSRQVVITTDNTSNVKLTCQLLK